MESVDLFMRLNGEQTTQVPATSRAQGQPTANGKDKDRDKSKDKNRDKNKDKDKGREQASDGDREDGDQPEHRIDSLA